MSRTPSMTVDQAETELGPRGHIVVNSENRATVRKWLVAKGFPASFCAELNNGDLHRAYNETDDTMLTVLRRRVNQQAFDAVPTPAAENIAPAAAPAPLDPYRHDPNPAPAVAPTPAPVPAAQDAATLLRNLLLQGYTPGLDENRVRAIVQESIAGIAPRVIEIKHENKAPIRIEGLVHPEFERCLNYLQKTGPNGFKMNVALVGPAGCGKTHLHGQLAKALGVDTGTISGSAGATESEIKGWLLPSDGGKFEYAPSDFVKKYERGNVLWNWDEMDAFDSNMLMCANVPLANGHMHVQQRRENPVVTRGENVYFLSTLNTFGTGANPLYCARNPLDEATRDRWIFVTVDYDKRLEESIAAAGGLSAAEMAGIWELRDRCREARLERVISTRAFQKAAVMKQCGESWREIRDRLLEGWSKDEKAKVGV